ncbi:hypothetical protein E2C01_052094 [Portunus trituberculatus]|uniref:Uncharacterized protein n=1 Tax=Portunus trituberculatus TaxID=210409 RepID=A0A5B7GCQ5_PORTR|nr:hypothetical protein [Portunus trituberculatus]
MHLVAFSSTVFSTSTSTTVAQVGSAVESELRSSKGSGSGRLWETPAASSPEGEKSENRLELAPKDSEGSTGLSILSIRTLNRVDNCSKLPSPEGDSYIVYVAQASDRLLRSVGGQ